MGDLPLITKLSKMQYKRLLVYIAHAKFINKYQGRRKTRSYFVKAEHEVCLFTLDADE